MVSRWMENGSILDYMRRYRGANRLELVGLRHDSTIWICAHGVPVNWSNSRPQLLAWERCYPWGLGKCNRVFPSFSPDSWSLMHHLPQPNIFVDSNGIPCLSDFGHCSIMTKVDSLGDSTSDNRMLRYVPPELLDFGKRSNMQKRSGKSDVYSLSMVIVEVCMVCVNVTYPDSDIFSPSL